MGNENEKQDTISNQYINDILEVDMDLQQTPLCNVLEAEIVGASAFMEAEELLDREGADYFRGFIQGYSHCLKLAGELDAISDEKELP